MVTIETEKEKEMEKEQEQEERRREKKKEEENGHSRPITALNRALVSSYVLCVYFFLSVLLLFVPWSGCARINLLCCSLFRIFARSDDDGESWVQLGYSPAELQDPVCQGSTISSANQAALFFSNADNPSSRINGKSVPASSTLASDVAFLCRGSHPVDKCFTVLWKT